MLKAITAPSDSLQVTNGQWQQSVPGNHSSNKPFGSTNWFLKPRSAFSDWELHLQLALHELMNMSENTTTTTTTVVKLKKTPLVSQSWWEAATAEPKFKLFLLRRPSKMAKPIAAEMRALIGAPVAKILTPKQNHQNFLAIESECSASTSYSLVINFGNDQYSDTRFTGNLSELLMKPLSIRIQAIIFITTRLHEICLKSSEPPPWSI